MTRKRGMLYHRARHTSVGANIWLNVALMIFICWPSRKYAFSALPSSYSVNVRLLWMLDYLLKLNGMNNPVLLLRHNTQTYPQTHAHLFLFMYYVSIFYMCDKNASVNFFEIPKPSTRQEDASYAMWHQCCNVENHARKTLRNECDNRTMKMLCCNAIWYYITSYDVTWYNNIDGKVHDCSISSGSRVLY